jgi:diaminopimelate decarboxylase
MHNAPPPAVADALTEATARYGTPAYVYDLARIRSRIERLIRALPPGVGVRYSVKANPAAAVCRVIAEAGLDAEISSAGELAVALDAGFRPDQILVSGPYKEPDLLNRLASQPGALISVDSLSELRQLTVGPAPLNRAGGILLRLRPDYPAAGEMPGGPEYRFGIPPGQLTPGAIRRALRCLGFHIYGGSQILDSTVAAGNLASAHDLAVRTAQRLGFRPRVVNLGGGFGVPCHEGVPELDLAPAAAALGAMMTTGPALTPILELGRYLVAEAGWYLTRVVHEQTLGSKPAVVVDGGIHHRPDLCGLDLARCCAPPVLLGPARGGARPTAVLGCLCLPWDILANEAMLPTLRTGDILAFPTVGAYGLTAAPLAFLGHRLPAEISLDDGRLALLPPSQPLLPPPTSTPRVLAMGAP